MKLAINPNLWLVLLLLIFNSNCFYNLKYRGSERLIVEKKYLGCKCKKEISFQNPLEKEIRKETNSKAAFLYCPIMKSKKYGFTIYQYWTVGNNITLANFLFVSDNRLFMIKDLDAFVERLKERKIPFNEIELIKRKLKKIEKVNSERKTDYF